MNFLETLARLIAVLQALPQASASLRAVAKTLRGLLPITSSLSYENILLGLTVDIRDRDGRLTLITRRQRVRLLAQDAVVIRDVVWGEGDAIAGYEVQGARRLGVESEGSKKVLLLSPWVPLSNGSEVVLTSERTVRDGFRQSSEYYELAVERPTDRLTIKVLFPKSRPPRQPRLATSPPGSHQGPLSLKHAADGRPFLSWSCRQPARYTTYGLRWSW